MIGLLGSTYPRISTQAYAAEFTEPQKEQTPAQPVDTVEVSFAIPERISDSAPPQSPDRAKLFEFLHLIRRTDAHGIYNGSSSTEEWTAAPLDLPHNTRTLEEKLASSSYGVDELATDFRSMCDAAVEQLFCADEMDLAQEASDILTLGNLQLQHFETRINSTATSQTPPGATAIEGEDAGPAVDPADPFGDSFWDIKLAGWADLLTLQARRVGFSKRQLEAAENAAEGAKATTGVKRKMAFSEKGPPAVRPRKCRFPPEMQAVVAGLLDTVTAKTAEEAAKVQAAKLDTARRGAGRFALACRAQVDKLRGSFAAEASRTLQFDFSSVSAKLRRAEYDSVDETFADLQESARQAAQNWDGSDEQAGMRKGKLLALADQFVSNLCDALEGLVIQYVPKQTSKQAAPVAAVAAAPEPLDYVPLPECIQFNREPYLQADWRKEPFVPRPYVRLTDYELGEERELLLWKLSTGLRGRCSGDHCTTRKGIGGYRLELEGFETECSCLSKHTECGEACGCFASGACLNRAVTDRRALVLGQDVQEVNTWGMDCYTRRNVQDAVLESEAFGPYTRPDYAALTLKGGANPLAMGETIHYDSNTSQQTAIKMTNEWIERIFHPAINRQGNEGWDIYRALADIRKQAEGRGEHSWLHAVDFLEARVTEVGQDFFRIHPKGIGIVCMRKGGLPPFTYVQEYLGEVHSPWRWFEIQDAIKKGNNEELPDFYNIVLERPRDDPAGYDVLFVDAASKGAFASRMSHSCTPNCQAVVMACGGRLTIAVYTLRHVYPGEELTFDYASVTESEKEFRAAICLCTTPRCRGSFLYFAGSRAFQQVLNEHHTLLHRQAMLLQASCQPLLPSDLTRLQEWGVRESVLGRKGTPERVPAWLEKWAALVLEFIEEERLLLSEQLCALQLPYTAYTPAAAAIEAKGIADNRLQNVAITLDKVKLCLSKPDQPQTAPLRLASPEQAKEHIWSGPKSIAKRLLRCLAPQMGHSLMARALEKASTSDEILDTLAEYQDGHPTLAHIATHIAQPADTFQEAKEKLLQLVDLVRELDMEMGGGHTCAADILTLYAHTEIWFTAERNYKSFSSAPVKLNVADLKLRGNTSNPPQAKPRPSLPAGKAREPMFGSDSFDLDTNMDDDGLRHPSANIWRATGLTKADLSKKYNPWFIWGQLNTWFKQDIYDPSATLSAARRGTISLPDIESCYFNSKARYNRKERAAVLEHIQKRPDAMWKTGTIFSFKNEAKVYGSPMFDAVFWKMYGGPASPMDRVFQQLRSAQIPTGVPRGNFSPSTHAPLAGD